MTPRPWQCSRRALVTGSLGLGLLALLGCDPRQAAYFLQPFEPTIAPACPALKGKKVAMIVKAAPGANGDFVALDREMAREVWTILRKKVPKIELVAMDKVWDWDKEHRDWTDPGAIAEAFDVDMVVFLEISRFQIASPSSPEMFEGHSSIHIRVVERAHPKDEREKPITDLPKEISVLYDGDRETTFPTRGPIPVSSEVTATSFKNRFLKLVAEEVSWHFVDHAPGDDIRDAKF